MNSSARFLLIVFVVALILVPAQVHAFGAGSKPLPISFQGTIVDS